MQRRTAFKSKEAERKAECLSSVHLPLALPLWTDESVSLEFDSRVNWTNGLSSMEMKVIECLFFPPTAPTVRQLQTGAQPAARNHKRLLGLTHMLASNFYETGF